MTPLNLQFDDIWFGFVLERFGLADMADYITSTNPSNNLRYHNTEHMFRMAQIAYKLYSCDNWYNDADARLLITACLWHDYDHSGGKESDSFNIDVACRSLRVWNEQHSHLFDSTELDKIYRIIMVTEFPFVYNPQGILERCIRDADLLYTLSDNTCEIVNGLFEEIRFKFEDQVNAPKLFIAGQQSFWANAVMFTDLGRTLKEELADQAIVMQQRYFNELYNI